MTPEKILDEARWSLRLAPWLFGAGVLAHGFCFVRYGPMPIKFILSLGGCALAWFVTIVTAWRRRSERLHFAQLFISVIACIAATTILSHFGQAVELLSPYDTRVLTEIQWRPGIQVLSTYAIFTMGPMTFLRDWVKRTARLD